MSSREEQFREENRRIIDSIMEAPPVEVLPFLSEERQSEQTVAAMEQHINGLLEQGEFWTKGRCRLTSFSEDGSVVNTTVTVTDEPGEPRKYGVRTDTRPSGKYRGLGTKSRQLEWSVGDSDAYRVDGGYRRDPARKGQQDAIDAENERMRAEWEQWKKQEDEEVEALLSSGEDEENILRASSLTDLSRPRQLPSPALRGSGDLQTALDGLQKGELQRPKRSGSILRTVGILKH